MIRLLQYKDLKDALPGFPRHAQGRNLHFSLAFCITRRASLMLLTNLFPLQFQFERATTLAAIRREPNAPIR